MTTQTIFPAICLRDARAGIDFLERAFGCRRLMVHDGPDGTVAHAELAFPGGGIVMLGSVRGGPDDHFAQPPGASGVYVAVDDPDALHARAIAAGAEEVMGLTDTDYGSRDFVVRDPEGNLWSFGTYRPAAA